MEAAQWRQRSPRVGHAPRGAPSTGPRRAGEGALGRRLRQVPPADAEDLGAAGRGLGQSRSGSARQMLRGSGVGAVRVPVGPGCGQRVGRPGVSVMAETGMRPGEKTVQQHDTLALARDLFFICLFKKDILKVPTQTKIAASL